MTIPATAKAISFVVTRDRARARAFYQDILGLKLVHEDDFAAVFDLNGVMLRMSTLQGFTPQAHTVLGWNLPDIAETVAALTKQGVKFNIYEGFGQDAAGIWTAPGSTTKVAWFNDPDGNVLSLTQF